MYSSINRLSVAVSEKQELLAGNYKTALIILFYLIGICLLIGVFFLIKFIVKKTITSSNMKMIQDIVFIHTDEVI